jgi:hypothetical protein
VVVVPVVLLCCASNLDSGVLISGSPGVALWRWRWRHRCKFYAPTRDVAEERTEASPAAALYSFDCQNKGGLLGRALEHKCRLPAPSCARHGMHGGVLTPVLVAGRWPRFPTSSYDLVLSFLRLNLSFLLYSQSLSRLGYKQQPGLETVCETGPAGHWRLCQAQAKEQSTI